jgi:hypothetical protein
MPLIDTTSALWETSVAEAVVMIEVNLACDPELLAEKVSPVKAPELDTAALTEATSEVVLPKASLTTTATAGIVLPATYEPGGWIPPVKLSCWAAPPTIATVELTLI